MACILRPECNFLHGYFRCRNVEMEDVEVKVKMMQGIHTFKRDRTSQVIKCSPWSTRPCPYPSLIWKMKTYLELEGKLGRKPRPQPQTCPQQTQLRPTQHSTNPLIRKAPGPKANDNRMKTILTKRKYKMRVLAQPVPASPTAPVNSTTPAPMVATTSTQTPVTRSATRSIMVMVYKLATGQFPEVPYPTTRPQDEGHLLTQNSNPPPLEDIPSAPVRQGPPWPNVGSASENFFETRKDWPIPPTPVLTPAPTIKTEAPPQVAVSPCAMVIPKQAAGGCSWGLHCPICKNEEEHKDWEGNDQRKQPRMHPQSTQHPQPQNAQQPQPQNVQCPQLQNNQNSQLFDIPNRYAEQIKLRKEWEERIERLNVKFNLDYYSSSESDTDSEPDYRYEHRYETLIWTILSTELLETSQSYS